MTSNFWFSGGNLDGLPKRNKTKNRQRRFYDN